MPIKDTVAEIKKELTGTEVPVFLYKVIRLSLLTEGHPEEQRDQHQVVRIPWDVLLRAE